MLERGVAMPETKGPEVFDGVCHSVFGFAGHATGSWPDLKKRLLAAGGVPLK